MNTSTTSIILKTDSRGHVHTPRQRREELLTEFERSGLPATQFAALAGVGYQTFATWVQKRRKEKGGMPEAAVQAGSWPLRLVEVSLGTQAVNSTTATPLRVLLPGGAVVEVAGGAQVPWLRSSSTLSARRCAMLSFTGSLKVFVALDPVDMRKGFEGLHAAVSEKLKADVRGGAIFTFTNKKRTRLKVLYWDKTGLWLMTKRLEKGTFCWPRSVEPGAVRISLAPEAFALLTDGIDMHEAKMRPWCELERREQANEMIDRGHACAFKGAHAPHTLHDDDDAAGSQTH